MAVEVQSEQGEERVFVTKIKSTDNQSPVREKIMDTILNNVFNNVKDERILMEYLQYIQSNHSHLEQSFQLELENANWEIVTRLLYVILTEHFFECEPYQLVQGLNVIKFKPNQDATLDSSSLSVQLQFYIEDLYCLDRFTLDKTKKLTLVEYGPTKESSCVIIHNYSGLVSVVEKYFGKTTTGYEQFEKDLDNCWVNMALSKVLSNERMELLKEEITKMNCKSVPEYIESMLKQDPSYSHVFYEQFHRRGHPTHPFVKSKVGLSVDQVTNYSPEFGGTIDPRLIAIHRSKGGFKSYDDQQEPCPNQFIFGLFPCIEEKVRDYFKMIGLELQDYYLNLIHPHQLSQPVISQFNQDIENNELIIIPSSMSSDISSRPLVSVRSLALQYKQSDQYNQTLPSIKCSFSVLLTTVVRTLNHSTCITSPQFSRILDDIFKRERGNGFGTKIHFVKDLMGIYYYHDDQTGAGGGGGKHQHKNAELSSLWRQNLHCFVTDPTTEQIVSVPALFNTSPISGTKLLFEFIDQLKTNQHITTTSKAIRLWMKHYFQLLLPFYIIMSTKYGVAIEAHHQNTYVIIDRGVPTKLIFKDWDCPRCVPERLDRQNIDYSSIKGTSILHFQDFTQKRAQIFIHVGELLMHVFAHLQTTNDSDEQSWTMEKELIQDSSTILQSTFNQLKSDPIIHDQVLQDQEYFFTTPFAEMLAYTKWRLNPTPSIPPHFLKNPWYQN
ncbi:hypothetical protein DFA_12325 [Cavenderia fasciculata]|uniref:IucA/IucC family protein n=1 Tax=Cavenderia fasciculata TaxID=261658 RepID=F4QD78_CACFS|nr:uncharacterized protein DFA_12325 [Cavenderia fasciculata]EGG14549.1 hypothetical protein DFA_12325 [Cavenderia fasciculata]|eukprot:XP_004366069.1 hypothetical protein DFA_12325 [Cavenderia fasciculata]